MFRLFSVGITFPAIILLHSNALRTLPDSKTSEQPSYQAWDAFSGLTATFSQLLGLSTILTSIFCHRQGGLVFTMVCLIYPLMTLQGRSSYQRKICNTFYFAMLISDSSIAMVVYCDNPHFLRRSALKYLTGTEYRQEIVINNLADYLVRGP